MEIASTCDIKPAVEAKGLVRTYRRGVEKIQALKGIDLDIKCGEFVGVVGHSGAGKTTLLNLIGFSLLTLAGCVALSLLLGLVAGFYPAFRAASVKPVEAIKAE